MEGDRTSWSSQGLMIYISKDYFVNNLSIMLITWNLWYTTGEANELAI